MANDTTKPVLKELEISILETSTNFTKQQLNELEMKLKQNDMLIAYDVERLKKEFIEFKKCVKNFKRHLVEAILLMTASIVFIYALFFFYK
jgi:ribosomal protein S13